MMMRRILAVSLVTAMGACGDTRPPSSPTIPPTQPPGASAPNQAPQITAATITPTLGVANVTTFRAHVEAIDADGDSLSFTWTYLGTVVGRGKDLVFLPCFCRDDMPVIGSPILVIVTDARGGEATATVRFVGATLTGAFDGYFGEVGHGFDFGLRLTQEGNRVTGTMVDRAMHQGIVDTAQPGRIEADGRFEIRMKMQSVGDFTMIGQLLPSNGPADGFFDGFVGKGRIEGGLFDGRLFTFGSHDPYLRTGPALGW